jgi:hypothetical protein
MCAGAPPPLAWLAPPVRCLLGALLSMLALPVLLPKLKLRLLWREFCSALESFASAELCSFCHSRLCARL